ncbi:MAG: 50S ribosomal protein L15, partial [Thermoprotei archaeon]
DKAGYDKLLGKGNITFKNVVIKVRAASKKAMNKIIGLGGKVILTGG